MIKKICIYTNILIIIFIIIIGLILTSSIFLPFKTLKTFIDLFAFDKSFGFFDLHFYLISKYIGIIFICIGIILCLSFKNIYLFSYNFIINLLIFLKEIFKKLYSFFKHENKFHLLAFFIILIFGILIRLIFISQPIKYDEAYTFINFVKNPLWMTIADLRSTNNHIFHSILVKISYKLFGDSLWAIRLPSFIFGILIMPASYLTSRIFYNKNSALITMSLIAASSYLIEFSTNARGYTILTFIFLISLCLANYIKDNNNLSVCLIFAFISSLGFFTMIIMLYPFLIIILWLLFSFALKDSSLSKKIFLKNLTILVLSTLIFSIFFYSRAIFKFGIKSAISSNFTKSEYFLYYLKNLFSFLKEIWFKYNRDIPIIIQLLLMICFIISLIFHKKIGKQKINIFIPAIIIFIIIILMQKNAIIFPRHWIFLLPIYMMLASSGISWLIELLINKINFIKLKLIIIPIISIALCVGICSEIYFSKSILISNETGIFKEAEIIVNYFNQNIKNNDIILSPDYITQPILTYYFDRKKISGLYFEFNEVKNKLNNSNNIYIILEKNQSLLNIIDFNLLKNYNYSDPELLKIYDSYYLYEVKKIK